MIYTERAKENYNKNLHTDKGGRNMIHTDRALLFWIFFNLEWYTGFQLSLEWQNKKLGINKNVKVSIGDKIWGVDRIRIRRVEHNSFDLFI